MIKTNPNFSYIKCLVFSPDSITLDIDSYNTDSNPGLSLISLFLHFYIAENLTGLIEHWYKEERDDWPFASEFMNIINNPDGTFTFVVESDYEEHKKNINHIALTKTLSEENFWELVKSFTLVNKQRPKIIYIIDKDGLIYIDTKIPDEIGLKITELQKEQTSFKKLK